MTIPTAMSTTLPRMANSRNSFSMTCPPSPGSDRALRFAGPERALRSTGSKRALGFPAAAGTLWFDAFLELDRDVFDTETVVQHRARRGEQLVAARAAHHHDVAAQRIEAARD